MITHLHAGVNESTSFCFKAITGTTVFPDLLVINNGVQVTPTPSIAITEIGATGIFSATYVPGATGRITVCVGGEILAFIEVLPRNPYLSIRNLEDESLGSWVWDKVLGTLNMIKMDGTPLASFSVVETTNVASRERV